jgi:cobalt/nickel transport protein
MTPVIRVRRHSPKRLLSILLPPLRPSLGDIFMKPILSALAAPALFAAAAIVPAQAHFQLIYTPEVNLEKAGDVPLLLVFWHPFSNGHAMNMGKPEQFFVVYKGEKTDLLGKLQPVTFKGAENSAAGYEAKIPVRRLGDYIFALVPAPYLEKSEDKYIQHTKSFVNVGGTPSGWDKPLGLATEIAAKQADFHHGRLDFHRPTPVGRQARRGR